MALITASNARWRAGLSGVLCSVWRSSTCRNSWQITAFTFASERQCLDTNSRFTIRRGRSSQVTASVGTLSVKHTSRTLSAARIANGFSSISSSSRLRNRSAFMRRTPPDRRAPGPASGSRASRAPGARRRTAARCRARAAAPARAPRARGRRAPRGAARSAPAGGR